MKFNCTMKVWTGPELLQEKTRTLDTYDDLKDLIADEIADDTETLEVLQIENQQMTITAEREMRGNRFEIRIYLKDGDAAKQYRLAKYEQDIEDFWHEMQTYGMLTDD